MTIKPQGDSHRFFGFLMMFYVDLESAFGDSQVYLMKKYHLLTRLYLHTLFLVLFHGAPSLRGVD